MFRIPWLIEETQSLKFTLIHNCEPCPAVKSAQHGLSSLSKKPKQPNQNHTKPKKQTEGTSVSFLANDQLILTSVCYKQSSSPSSIWYAINFELQNL